MSGAAGVTDSASSAQQGFPDGILESFAVKYSEDLHQKLPGMMVGKVVNNIKSTIEACIVGNSIPVGDGCTGSGVWLKWMEAQRVVRKAKYGIRFGGYLHKVAAENENPKRQFLDRHHEIELMLADVGHLNRARVSDTRDSDKIGYVPATSIFGGGFSCIDKSKQNCKRGTTGKQAVRSGSGSTHTTFDGIAEYIIKYRPLVSFLENLPETEHKDFHDPIDDSWCAVASHMG